MKKLFITFLLLPLFAAAQEKIINHTVAPKESYSSIGRMYNINGRELANYNKLDYDKGLSIGQILKVPVKKDAVINVAPPTQVQQPKTTSSQKNGDAIYHTVQSKETLYGVSKKYNVSVADIKKWNNLTVDGLNVGANIIVGYGGSNALPPVVEKIEQKKDVVTKPVVETPKAETEKPTVVEVKKVEPVKETKQVATQVVNRTIGNGFNGGYFKDNYVEKGGWDAAKEIGTAAVFKSNSGWDDGKYYCLHNTAAQGSIVKITNNVNGKTVYAKVLDIIPDIKQNAGIVIRISNAAAAELGVGENQFECTINYIK